MIVELLEDVKNECRLTKGLKGEVQFVDDIGSIKINWENGSTLGLDYDLDYFRVVLEVDDNIKDTIFSKMELELMKNRYRTLNYTDEALILVKKYMRKFCCKIISFFLHEDQYKALAYSETILEDAYRFMLDGKYPKDLDSFEQETSIIVLKYIKQVEKKYFTELLYDKVKNEFEKRYDEICAMTSEKAIENADEVVVKSDLCTYFQNMDYLNIEHIKVLLNKKKSLHYIYIQVEDFPLAYIDDLRDYIKHAANVIS